MKKIVLIGLFFLPLLGSSQVLSLDEALKLALENNFDLVSASQSAEVARLQNHVGNAGMLPTITLNGNAQYGLNSLRQEFSNGLTENNNSVNTRAFGAGATLDWVIFDGLRMFAVKKRLQTQFEAADLNLRDQMGKTIAEVIRTYTLLGAETQRLKALEKTEVYFGQLAELADNRLKIGTGNKQEVLQARIDRNAQRSAILSQRAYLEQLRIQLNMLMNREPDTRFTVDSVISVNANLVLEESLTNAGSANPSVLIAEKNVAVFRANLKEQSSFQMPSLSVNLAYNYNYSGSTAGFALFNQTNGPSVGARLAFPIFDGWRVRRNITTAKVQYETAKFNSEYTRTRVAAEVRTAYELYRRQLEILDLEKENIQLAEENLSIATQRYKTGVGTLIESRAAALSYVDAQTRYTQAQSATKTAETNLLVLTGQLVK